MLFLFPVGILSFITNDHQSLELPSREGKSSRGTLVMHAFDLPPNISTINEVENNFFQDPKISDHKFCGFSLVITNLFTLDTFLLHHPEYLEDTPFCRDSVRMLNLSSEKFITVSNAGSNLQCHWPKTSFGHVDFKRLLEAQDLLPTLNDLFRFLL